MRIRAGTGLSLTQFFEGRWLLFLASLTYALVILLCLRDYASVNWWEYGYSYGDLDLLEGALILAGLGTWSLLVPKSMHSASSAVLVIVYFAVCIPGLVVPLGLERSAQAASIGIALWLVVSFALCCSLVSALKPGIGAGVRQVSGFVVPVLLAAWIVCVVWLVAEYRSIMTLVSLEAIYEQRAVGAATSRAIGYAQTYLGYVLSPALLVLGLFKRSWWMIALGFAGGLVLYSITAEKNAFSFPFLICGFAFLVSRKNASFRSTSFLLLALSVVLFPAVAFSETSLVASFFAWYIGVRSLLTPGLFIAQYADFFAARGYTLWGHVTGMGVLVPRPQGLADDRWPSLGHIVGEQHIGKPDLNANANFVASDGIAALGEPGIAVIFTALAMYLVALDRAASGLDRRLVVLLVLPMALTLTNVSFFTVMLSFGGLFWLLALPAASRRKGAAGTGPF
jgi:hypothetical protein